MEVTFTRHALQKIVLLGRHDVRIDRNLVEEAVSSPERTIIGLGGKSIAEKELDRNHVLRVVFVREESQIRVITMYPARKGRY